MTGRAGRQVTSAVGTSIVGTLIFRILGLAGLTGVLASALTPLPNIIIARMGGVERLERSDAVIVLARGGFDPDGVLSNSSLRRTLQGYRALPARPRASSRPLGRHPVDGGRRSGPPDAARPGARGTRRGHACGVERADHS